MKLKNADIERASQQHFQDIEDDVTVSLAFSFIPNDGMDDIKGYITDAFGVGAQWGAQRIIKDLWHDVSEEPSRYDDYLVKTKQGCFDTAHYNMGGWYAPYMGGGTVIQWLDLADILPQQD